MMKQVELEIGIEKIGQGLDSKKKNTVHARERMHQILRNKLEREKAGVVFLFLPNFSISVRVNKEQIPPLAST